MAIGVQVWSQIASQNSSSDTNVNFAEGQAPSSLNDSCRAAMASIAKWRDDNNATLVTGGTTVAATITTNQVEGSLTGGYTVAAQFTNTMDSSATLAVDGLAAQQIQLVPGTNLKGQEIQAGTVHRLTYLSSGSGAWVLNDYVKTVVQNSPFSSLSSTSITGSVALSTSTFTDGPSVAQGSTGVWLAIGKATVKFGATNNNVLLKLWDGTNFIDSGIVQGYTGAALEMGFVQGIITNPSGNIRISAQSGVAGGGDTLAFNASGLGRDCSLVVMRIG